jgi:hypothetical protein
MGRSPSQLGGNPPKGESVEFLRVKNFPFLPRIALHFYLKNKKVLGRKGSTFCPRKKEKLVSLFFRSPLSGEKECVLGFPLPIRCAKHLYAFKCETCAIAPGFMPKGAVTSSAGFG